VSRDRGQASVEIVACCVVLVLAAIAIAQLLAIARTRVEAERIADQAAELQGDRVVVRVPLPLALPGGPSDEIVTTTIRP
jgi:hypothetical protein